MLFLVPGYPAENYLYSLAHGRFIVGVVPFISGITLIWVARCVWMGTGLTPR